MASILLQLRFWVSQEVISRIASNLLTSSHDKLWGVGVFGGARNKDRIVEVIWNLYMRMYGNSKVETKNDPDPETETGNVNSSFRIRFHFFFGSEQLMVCTSENPSRKITKSRHRNQERSGLWRTHPWSSWTTCHFLPTNSLNNHIKNASENLSKLYSICLKMT